MTEVEYRLLSQAERLRVTIRNAQQFFAVERAAVSIETEEFGTLTREQIARAAEVDASRTLTDDERALLAHVSMFGSSGYPVRKYRSGKWAYDFRSISAPTIYKTRREAVAQFEAYQDALIGYVGAEAFRRAVCGL